MVTKLTLTLQKEVIESAKKYAAEQGRSLSDLVENYFKLLTEQKPITKAEEPPVKYKRLKGILKVEQDFDYKTMLEEELTKKHND
ncbi:MAG: hypothetical protein COW03_07400 [Cytophagales bacterium CG12_big_fil_rev_8_21_14_0_65_40_12]|nr:MAG: hypothetical protein COW03_07400 [Cytophagales bacterium CG12_big_fil_rev_8_21_14_0_65_40_12]PIW03664.1 MAG: hypothetical protein COW40_13745 [Cytophagales bacterium CG17_big_fil_post_rev_8_21_14_2_50_40_13]